MRKNYRQTFNVILSAVSGFLMCASSQALAQVSEAPVVCPAIQALVVAGQILIWALSDQMTYLIVSQSRFTAVSQSLLANVPNA